MWAHSAHADTSFCFKTSRSCVTKHHLSSKQTRSNSALILLIWSLVGEMQKSKPLLNNSLSETQRTLLENCVKPLKKSSLVEKPSARSFFCWTSCGSHSSWFLLASKNFSTGPNTRLPTCLKRTISCPYLKSVATTNRWRRLLVPWLTESCEMNARSGLPVIYCRPVEFILWEHGRKVVHNTFSKKINSSLMWNILALRKFDLPEQNLRSVSKIVTNQLWYTTSRSAE